MITPLEYAIALLYASVIVAAGRMTFDIGRLIRRYLTTL